MSCSTSDPPTYCSAASPELKLYQAFIFSVPVFFTFVLLLLFYLFYLRRRRASWQSLRMRANHLSRGDLPRPSESGIKKEVREMLPVVVFKESFLIRETQCSVCLGEYQSDERLQRIPPCGHTFHVDCIDHWLATNTTCPLCRVSLLPVTKVSMRIKQMRGRERMQMKMFDMYGVKLKNLGTMKRCQWWLILNLSVVLREVKKYELPTMAYIWWQIWQTKKITWKNQKGTNLKVLPLQNLPVGPWEKSIP
ncbi:RING-H2 finger protein ATL7-like isoform X2 [Typha latifolia]|uniref:RING-H2 finger protein ATL7-like isoform X2 n=1 Tax=Typha latifolia TaxID=4733 RepID=UPI003C2B0AB3